MHFFAEDNRARSVKGLFSVKNHAKGSIRKARRHSGGARALEAVRVFDFDDNAVVEVIGVRGEDRKACFDKRRATKRKQDQRWVVIEIVSIRDPGFRRYFTFLLFASTLNLQVVDRKTFTHCSLDGLFGVFIQSGSYR